MYTVQRECSYEPPGKKPKNWSPGDTIKSGDVPANVVKEWLKIGAITKED